jgi:signal transduction histidine kinase/ActR/RegA family two-component response regulator
MVEQRTAELKHANARAEHLNAVLRAIRHVNQLIVKEKDRSRLLEQACDLLIETPGYVSAWIGTTNGAGVVQPAGQAGLRGELSDLLGRGAQLACVSEALGSAGVRVFDGQLTACTDCATANECRGHSTLAARLEHGRRVFGVLSVGVPSPFEESEEEMSLLREMAGDVAFALWSIDQEEALDRARRARRVLSQSNHAVIRAADEASLRSEACRIIVEEGGYRFAWVGLAPDHPDGTLERVAHAGFEDGYLDALDVTWADAERGRGPANVAIGSGASSVVRNIATDPRFALWREAATARGYASCVALPLSAGQRTVGMLTIYASEPDAFDDDELRLLEQLAADLGFGIATLRDRLERESLTSQLLHAQRMEAVGRLAGGIAHDFNNLLAAIISFSHFVYDGLAENDTRRDDLRQALMAADRASGLTRQLLTFSQRRPVQPRSLDLNDAVAQLDKILRMTAGENVEIVSILADELWTTFVDPGQLDQVLLNLAVNARDAMPHGGTLTIETTNVSFCGGAGEVAPGDYVMLEVRDTGEGMSDEVAAQVFEPFFTTKGAQGSGLGLSTCFGIVRQAGGYITARSRPGGGTAITVLLPRVDVEPSPAEQNDHRPTQSAAGDGLVLVVEDQPLVLSAACRILRDAGFAVLEAASAEEGLATIGRLRADVRLVVSDIVLPNMSGYDLVAGLQAQYPSVRVLLMSGYLDGDHASRTAIPDSVPFLAKPFTPASMLRAVHEALGESDS